MTNQEAFTTAYIQAIYSTETGDNEQPPADAELTPLCNAHCLNQCAAFWRAYEDLIVAAGVDPSQAGHDFWLTRNGHGVGFWDRPEIYGEELADQLTRASKACGEYDADFITEDEAP